ncbi:uncharacterized protein LOC111813516 [Octodon degus]|uniref:Uncharacterized protein LOC111813516 n=1 Tax=Octodon degus TaxID=10160 RepID=A0A6P6DKJ6_OCTDE|nr:uncharacterized protein LOC111813516 [Octodon degus]
MELLTRDKGSVVQLQFLMVPGPVQPRRLRSLCRKGFLLPLPITWILSGEGRIFAGSPGPAALRRREGFEAGLRSRRRLQGPRGAPRPAHAGRSPGGAAPGGSLNPREAVKQLRQEWEPQSSRTPEFLEAAMFTIQPIVCDSYCVMPGRDSTSLDLQCLIHDPQLGLEVSQISHAHLLYDFKRLFHGLAMQRLVDGFSSCLNFLAYVH